MEAFEVLGALALLLAVAGGASWWRAGRRGVDHDRLRDRRVDQAAAEYRAGPRRPDLGTGGFQG